MTENDINHEKFNMIITIVKKGLGSKIIEVSKKSGAEGGTIILGKGIAEKKIYQELLGIDFNPEKEVVLTLVQHNHIDEVLEAITNRADLNKPGKGIAFVIDIKAYCGIAHLLDRWKSTDGGDK